MISCRAKHATNLALRIFVVGDPDGLRIVKETNWNDKPVMFSRAAWAQPSVADRPELQHTGMHLLLGTSDEGEGDRPYIGEGNPIMPRLASAAFQQGDNYECC